MGIRHTGQRQRGVRENTVGGGQSLDNLHIFSPCEISYNLPFQINTKSPFTDGEANKKLDKQVLTYRSQGFELYAHHYECVDTGETFSTEDLDELNLLQLHNQYRERNHIPFPEQIKSLREQYGVSQRTMSALLGFGVNQYRSYEEGEIPSLSNVKLLSLARDVRNFRELILDRKEELRERELTNLLSQVDNLVFAKDNVNEAVLNAIWNPLEIPNEYTGYRVPNFNKFAQMVLYFFDQIPYLYTVRLNKLLFYADFGHFKRSGYSISGAHSSKKFPTTTPPASRE